MNRPVAKYLLMLLGFCLLSVQPVFAQTATPQASQPVMIFTDMGHAATSLVFTVNRDGTATLAISRLEGETRQTVWQQTGPITPSQLDQVTGFVKLLSSATDQSWRHKDYLFEFPTADGNAKPLNIYDEYQHVEPNMDATLQKVVQTLLDLRKPLEPLVVFGWSGGFVGRDSQLTVSADGSMSYEERRGKGKVTGKIAQADMEKLNRLIKDDAVSTYKPKVTASCADCFEYSIFVLTPDGIWTIDVDEVTLESAPQPIKDLVALLVDLTKQAASLPTPTSTTTAAPTADCCDHTIKPGDYNRYISVLGPDDVLVGAARRLQLRPNEAPTECVVFVFHGPLSYDVTLFDGFWLEQKSNLDPKALDALTQSAMKTVTDSCGEGHVQILRIP